MVVSHAEQSLLPLKQAITSALFLFLQSGFSNKVLFYIKDLILLLNHVGYLPLNIIVSFMRNTFLERLRWFYETQQLYH